MYEWNGSRWAAAPSPTNAGEIIYGIACFPTKDCIAVGTIDHSNGFTAQAWFWNGSTWTDQSTYNTGSTTNVLYGIKCAGSTSCEAVGWHFNATGNDYSLAEFWNGSTWTDQSTMGAPPGQLFGVSCVSPSECEAVGANFTTGVMTLALGWNGSTWTSQTMPNEPGAYLQAVSCYSTGCTAVGNSDNDTLAESWDGSQWTLQSSVGSGDPSGSAYAVWNAVHCQSASSCTAVGQWYPIRSYHTLASTWNGSAWTTNNTPTPKAKGGDGLNALSCTSSGSVCTAVGFHSLALRN